MLNVVVTETGPLFTLAEAKQHLRVDFNDDDALIETYANAAVARVLAYCNISTVPEGEIPVAAFKVAALLLLGALYENRDDGSFPPSAALLINPYRWLRV
ncbi:head-tail connector protein [Brevundimonas sp.]|uniref:head-tail connector protein n=1 Tax=Brevundimonas sp. TaxID=1871086 RepID=UPI0028984D59|nr:head-tail connector protein [Brevundimonas sp.]